METVDPKIIEKDGKVFSTLPDGNQVLIENEVINDPNWILTTEVEAALKVGDRQVRNLAKKHGWEKKYAYINKKPVTYYYKPKIESFQRDRVTEAVVIPVVPNKELNDEKTGQEVGGKGLSSKNTLAELDEVLKKVSPYVGEFLETHKKNQDRLVELENKKATAEKSAIFWRTTAVWVAAGGILAVVAWYKADLINSTLSRSAGDLTEKYESTQKELYDTKLKLVQKPQGPDSGITNVQIPALQTGTNSSDKKN